MEIEKTRQTNVVQNRCATQKVIIITEANGNIQSRAQEFGDKKKAISVNYLFYNGK